MGVVCVDRGYEVSFASAAVTNVKETKFPRKATTEEEVLEPVAAFVQLYRENSRSLHRITNGWPRSALAGAKLKSPIPRYDGPYLTGSCSANPSTRRTLRLKKRRPPNDANGTRWATRH